MFQEYKVYIENIRNNLIQNNVDVEVVDIENYRDLFMYTFTLEQIIWFFQMLGISNSQYKIQSKYISDEREEEKIRQLAYKEFIENVDDFRKVSSAYQKLQKEIELSKDSDDIGDIDIDENEEIDLDSAEVKKVYEPTEEVVDKSLQKSESMVNLYQSKGSEFVSHGIYIDEWQNPTPESVTEGNIDKEGEITSHGIYIDEWINPNKVDNIEYVDASDLSEYEEEDDEIIYEEEDDIIYEEESAEFNEEDVGIIYEESSDESEEEGFDGLIYENDEEDEEVEEDDGLIFEEVDEENEMEEGTVYEEEDGIIYEDDDYEEDGLIFEEEDEAEDDEGLIYEEEDDEGLIFEEEDENNGLDFNEEGNEYTKEPVQNERVSLNNVSGNTSLSRPKDRDLSDNLQDVTNKVINEGIRLVSRAFKKME